MSSEFVDDLVHRERAIDLIVSESNSASKQAAAISEPDPDHLPPPQYPASEASSSSRPPPFSSLFATVEEHSPQAGKLPVSVPEVVASSSVAAPAYSYDLEDSVPFDPDQGTSRVFCDHVAETKRALPSDTKGESSRKDEDTEPPPAYSEGDSPLQSFTYLMSAAGGASSIITQVQQGGPPVNALGGNFNSLEVGLTKTDANCRCRSRRNYRNGPSVSFESWPNGNSHANTVQWYPFRVIQR